MNANFETDTRLTKLPKVKSVYVVITNQNEVHAVFGGECPLVADAVRQALDVYPESVRRLDSPVTPMGQDIYAVSWSYLMAIRGLFHFLEHSELEKLPSLWPETFGYRLVVSS